MCNQMGPNMGEWSFSEGVGLSNLILSIISVLSKTNITPSFENYELFTGFHCNFSCCCCWTLCKGSNTTLSLSASLSLFHTQTHTALTYSFLSSISHKTYIKWPAAKEPHPSWYLCIITTHWSLLSISAHKRGPSATLITPVSTMALFVQLVSVCLPIYCFYWAVCMFSSLGDRS